jgi:hypothetical protein
MLLRRKHLSGRIDVGHLLKLRLLPLSLFPPLFFLLSASVLGYPPLFCLTLSLLLFCLLTRSAPWYKEIIQQCRSERTVVSVAVVGGGPPFAA